MLINNVYCKKRDQIISFENIFFNVQHISLYICGRLSFKTPTMIQGLLEKQQQQKSPMNLINEKPVNWTLTRCLQGFLTLNSNVTVLTYFCFLWLCRGLYFFVKLFAGHFLSRKDTEAFYIWCKKAAKNTF